MLLLSRIKYIVWNHQFQFAGYYAAQQQGFYAAEGLNVEIRGGGYDQQGRAVRPVDLTQIGNRRKFEQNLAHEFSRAKRYQSPLSLIEIDIDDFKQINDQFGHQAGDEVIKRLAIVTGVQLRESDYFSRNGGEEFVVISTNSTENQALVLAERIRQANMKKHVDYGGVNIQYTVSLGDAVLQTTDRCSDDLFRRCDQALYQAKIQGRNQDVMG